MSASLIGDSASWRYFSRSRWIFMWISPMRSRSSGVSSSRFISSIRGRKRATRFSGASAERNLLMFSGESMAFILLICSAKPSVESAV